jgi:tetratricopeptide (TPR) repeat protein
VARPSAHPAPAPKSSIRLTPEDYLARALSARTSATRARAALASRLLADRTTHALLLRQLSIAHYESRRFRKAYDVALQALDLRVLVDVVHQDAARAAQALGQSEDAIGHLRLAARRGPAGRRAFHLWTLGGALFMLGRLSEAIGYFDRATRWGTTDRPLYAAQAAVARLCRGEPVPEAPRLFEQLVASSTSQGYGRFVLGQLAYHLRQWDDARRYLEAFIRRTENGRPALGLSLAGELAFARATLGKMRAN